MIYVSMGIFDIHIQRAANLGQGVIGRSSPGLDYWFPAAESHEINRHPASHLHIMQGSHKAWLSVFDTEWMDMSISRYISMGQAWQPGVWIASLTSAHDHEVCMTGQVSRHALIHSPQRD